MNTVKFKGIHAMGHRYRMLCRAHTFHLQMGTPPAHIAIERDALLKQMQAHPDYVQYCKLVDANKHYFAKH